MIARRDALPYETGAFDVVTAFNSVQFAADPVAAVRSMSQAARSGGLISLLVWGRRSSERAA